MHPQRTLYSAHRLTPPACEVCSQEHGISRCEHCQSVYYCGWDHRYQGIHAEKCEHILSERKRLESMLAKHKKNRENGHVEVEDPLQGILGPYPDSRDVAKSYMVLVFSILDVFGQRGGRREAVQRAAELLESVQALDIRDVVRCRQFLTACYIRLGRDDEAYDFIRSFDYSKNSHAGRIVLPCLDLTAPNVLQTRVPARQNPSRVDDHFVKLVMLMKIRVFFELQEIQKVRKVTRQLFLPELDYVVQGWCMSPTLFRYRSINSLWTDEEVRDLKLRIKDDVKQLFKTLHTANPDFWLQLLIDVGAIPPEQGRTPGGDVRLQGNCFPEWAETPGAVDIVMTLGGFDRPRE